MNKTLLHILFGAQRGGCEVNALEVIRGLPDLSHHVAVLGPTGPMVDAWTQAGAAVQIIGPHAATLFGAAQSMRELLKVSRPDAAILWHGLVHLPQLISVLNPAKIPFVVHGGNPAHTMSRWVDWRYVMLEKLFRPRGPLPTYVCCSQYVAKSFQSSRYLRRFPTKVVYNGVKTPDRPLHQPRQLTRDDAPIIGMVARLNSIKDHAALIRAMPYVLQEYPKAILELAGDGDLRSSLERLALDLGIGQSVRFLGEVSDVYAVMSNWDLFAYSTTEREGLGNALAEAMMFGLPCVVTDVGPMREFKQETCNGLTVQLTSSGNAMRLSSDVSEVLSDVRLRRMFSKSAVDFAIERFASQSFCDAYLQSLRPLL